MPKLSIFDIFDLSSYHLNILTIILHNEHIEYIELIKHAAVHSNFWSCRSREKSVLRSNNDNNESDERFTR